jgi:hypothetical protein
MRSLPKQSRQTCGLYYKPMTIVNDDSRVITKLETSPTDNARVVIYDRHMFIVQATGHCARFKRQYFSCGHKKN